MALNKRPHLMNYTREGVKQGQDPETGFPLPNLLGATFIDVPCRFHLESTKIYGNEDGTNETVRQIGTIRMNAGAELPEVGIIVTVFDKGREIFKGPVREHYYGQMSGRLGV